MDPNLRAWPSLGTQWLGVSITAAPGPRAAKPPLRRRARRRIRAASFDHPIGNREQAGREPEIKRLGGREVDNELEFGRLQNRQVRWLSALKNSAHIDACLANGVDVARSIAHQPTGFSKLGNRINRGDGMARRQRREFYQTPEEQCPWGDHQCFSSLLHEAGKSRIDFVAGGGFDGFDLPPFRRSHRLYVFRDGSLIRIVWIDEQGKARGARQQVMKQPEPLCPNQVV